MHSAFIIVVGATITIGALLFSGALLFFLQSAFLFLHSAFLILHSAPFKFPVWVSTCIFSLIVSQRAILFILVQLLFQFSSVKRLSLDLWNEIFDDIMCINSNINFVQNF